MSKYTTELRYIIENYNDDTESDNATSDELIASALPKLFNFDFPIYDESYRTTLETNIVRHFYTREICTETVGRWKMFLRDRLFLIMPKYNIMYKELEELQDKLLVNVDITETSELESQDKSKTNSKSNSTSKGNSSYNDNATASGSGTGKNSSVSDGGGTSDAWQTANDTPQGALTDIENNRYLSSATHNKSKTTQNATSSSDSSTTQSSDSKSNGTSSNTTNGTSTNDSNSEVNSTESYVKHQLGKRGGSIYLTIYNQLVQSYLNIDEMIIHELDDLFFQLW